MPEPEKPLVKVPKGFTCEWGSTQPDTKNQIVDDDRYSPFYAHYFANGKRKHLIYFGLMPESNDPVVLAVEGESDCTPAVLFVVRLTLVWGQRRTARMRICLRTRRFGDCCSHAKYVYAWVCTL